MDRQSFIILAVCFGLLLAWGPLINHFYPAEKRRPSPNTNQVDHADRVDPINQANQANRSNQKDSPNPMDSNGNFLENQMPADFSEQSVRLENDLASYLFGNVEGGIEVIDLKKYPNETGCGDEDYFDSESFVQLNPWSQSSVLSLRLGSANIRGFSISKNGNAVSLSRALDNGLRIEKTFALSTNYLIHAKIRILNTSEVPIEVPSQYWTIGTATPLSAEDNGILMGLMYSDGSEIESIKEGWFANRTLGCFPGHPRSLFENREMPIHWGSVGNQFFTLALIPTQPAHEILGTQVSLHFEDDIATNYIIKKGYKAELGFDAKVLQAGDIIEHQFDIFAGPKEYNTLAQLSSSFGNQLDGIMDFDGFFGFFAKALLLSMNGLNSWGLSYGFSIVVITFIIKILFWPLTQASTRSMKRMAALQPQMKGIQEKYKEDPTKMNRKLMEFMKENRVSPLGGCLPILLQLPVFFGFYTMLQSAIELRGASFLWTCDLSKPDTLFIIPGLGIPFNLWPILMGAAQLWQTSMTPPSPGMDPVQQKIMKYMPLMFVFILYNFSAGLALYWTMQNLLSIVQMKLTKNEPMNVKPVVKTPRAKKKIKGKKGRLNL